VAMRGGRGRPPPLQPSEGKEGGDPHRRPGTPQGENSIPRAADGGRNALGEARPQGPPLPQTGPTQGTAGAPRRDGEPPVARLPRAAAEGAPAHGSTTSFLTAAMLVYATGAGITAAAGTRLALQSILTAGFG